MDKAPTPIPNKGEIIENESLNIEIDQKKYILYLKSKSESINLSLSKSEDNYLLYKRKLSLNELKEISQFFSLLNSCHDFSVHLKNLNNEKKLSFIKKNKEIVLFFTVEYFSKKKDIEISLYSENKYDEFLEERIIKLEKENKEIKKEIAELKTIVESINVKFKESININKHIFNNNSAIMKQNEFDLISLAIKSRLNKNIIEIKKLYQATIDGDGPINFHSRCDNIPNTLTLIKSEGNRRFGGFASECWKSPPKFVYKDDINAFLFSWDKHKIYPYRKDGNALELEQNYDPTFGVGPSSIYGK